MKATLALLLPALVAAYPTYIQCDLTGSQTQANLAVATTIMGATVIDSAAIATASASTYEANTALTWTWDQALLTQGFVKASAGVISGLSGATARVDCSGTAVAQYTSASLRSSPPLRPPSLATALSRNLSLSLSLSLSFFLSLSLRFSCYSAAARAEHACRPNEVTRPLTPAHIASTPSQAPLAPTSSGPRRRTCLVSRVSPSTSLGMRSRGRVR